MTANARIDFAAVSDAYDHVVVHVRKYDSYETAYGNLAYTPASASQAQAQTAPTMTLAQMIDWCESHGYHVRQWANGARAWLGQPKPIRTRDEIQRLRERLNQQRDRGSLPDGLQIHTLDLRYDL